MALAAAQRFVSGHGFTACPEQSRRVPTSIFLPLLTRNDSRMRITPRRTFEPHLLNDTSEDVPDTTHRTCGRARAEGEQLRLRRRSRIPFRLRPHFFGSCSCIFFISSAVSGWLVITCSTIVFTISSHDPADSFRSHGPPSSLEIRAERQCFCDFHPAVFPFCDKQLAEHIRL